MLKNILFFIAGALFMSALAWAGSYSVTVQTNGSTDLILPSFVGQYNTKNNTAYTTLQYAGKVCGDALDQRAAAILKLMGE